MENKNLPRVLIVGTVPYNKNATSRAFDAYFHNWPKDKLAQVFSINKAPTKGHCGRFFQITDQRLLKRRFSNKVKTGIAFEDENLQSEWNDNKLETKSSFFTKLYKIGSNKTPFIFLMRKWLWKKKYWLTKEFNDWLIDFCPQVVFLSFSDDFFIPEIALYIATKFNIPIVSSTGDDYIFNNHFSLSPLYHIYRHKYKKLIKKIMNYPGDIIYISDKIRDKYNEYYGRHGQTIYLSSEINYSALEKEERSTPIFSYFGNVRNGRNDSLVSIACALQKINSDFMINVYTNENKEQYLKVLKKCKGINLCDSIPYSEVVKKTTESDFLIIVEGTKAKDILTTKYSLSTKVADCLSSGIPTIAFGSEECGVIQYLKATDTACVITNEQELEFSLNEFIFSKDAINRKLENAKKTYQDNHLLEVNNRRFEKIVMDTFIENTSRVFSNEISLLILSCNAFADIWDANFTLLEQNFGDRNMETYLLSDKTNTSVKRDNIHFIFAGEDKEFSHRIQEALKQIKTKYVLITLDDYLFTKQIKKDEIYQMLEIVKKENYAYFRLFNTPAGKKKTIYKYVKTINPLEVYDVNLYPGIWKKSILSEMVETELNPWELEVSLSKRMEGNGYQCAMTNKKVLPFMDTIRKGKLLINANRYLKRNKLYFGDRKRIKLIKSLELTIAWNLKKILPKKLLKRIKKYLRKKGMKFYSE